MNILRLQQLFLLFQQILQCLNCLVSSIRHFLCIFFLVYTHSGFVFLNLIFELIVLAKVLVTKLPFSHRVYFNLLLANLVHQRFYLVLKGFYSAGALVTIYNMWFRPVRCELTLVDRILIQLSEIQISLKLLLTQSMHWCISPLCSLIKLFIYANVLPSCCSVWNWINPSWFTKLIGLISVVCVPIVVKELFLSFIITCSELFSFLKHLRLTLWRFLFKNKDRLISLVEQSCVIINFLGKVNIWTFKAILFELHLLEIIAHFNQSFADIFVLTMSKILIHSFSRCFSDSKSLNLILFITQLISSLHQLDFEVSTIFTHELVVTC